MVTTFFAIAAQVKWPINHLDMKSAFLNGELPEDVYVDQAKGLVIPGNEKLVYKLRKALHELREAPKA